MKIGILELKENFSSGKKPTGDDFENLIDTLSASADIQAVGEDEIKEIVGLFKMQNMTHIKEWSDK